MAATNTLQNSINWVLPFLNYAPVNLGTAGEPAITSANTILQTILAPPFAWKWNRATAFYTVAAGQQDFTLSLASFGFIEKASVYIPMGDMFELEVMPLLGDSPVRSRPTFISAQLDDDAGNITFRLMPVPEQAYSGSIIYQKSAPIIDATTDTWTPIPDYLKYIYNWGFLSLMQDYLNSGDAAHMRQLFVSSLINVSEGLDDTQKNLFIQSWLGDMRQVAATTNNSQLSARSKGI